MRIDTPDTIDAGSKNKDIKSKGLFDWHRHPYAVPIFVFFSLLIASCAGFLLFSGETVGPSDSRVVHLYVDGQKRVVPTRAHTVGEALERAGVELREGDKAEPALDTPILEEDFNVNIYRAVPVTVIDERGNKITTKVSESTPDDMAKNAGVKVYPEDKVKIASADEALKDGVIGPKVVIDRATPTNINLYGTNIPSRTHAETVGELLEEKGIKTLDGDTVQPSRETSVKEDLQIFITRFGKKIDSVEEAIEPPVETIQDANMLAGTTEVKEPGSAGKKVVTYEVELKNGQEVSRRPIQEVVAVKPVKRVVAEGTKVVISNPSANVTLGQSLAASRGWTGSEFQCLYLLWQKESGWNHLASNPSGAYGIPQSLPGSKMATVGSDWSTNPSTQITWGLGYIARSYGTPCGAWAKSQASGWY